MKNLYAQCAGIDRRKAAGLKVCDGCGREFKALQPVESDTATDNGFIWYLCPECHGTGRTVETTRHAAAVRRTV
jgi:hypothetical protein